MKKIYIYISYYIFIKIIISNILTTAYTTDCLLKKMARAECYSAPAEYILVSIFLYCHLFQRRYIPYIYIGAVRRNAYISSTTTHFTILQLGSSPLRSAAFRVDRNPAFPSVSFVFLFII